MYSQSKTANLTSQSCPELGGAQFGLGPRSSELTRCGCPQLFYYYYCFLLLAVIVLLYFSLLGVTERSHDPDLQSAL